jgi:gamma-glutamyltranspeptidase/glutathione hydrolase/leukotriene-C4 hydrolase
LLLFHLPVTKFIHFRVKWAAPVTANLINNVTMYSVPAPGSGVLLALILNILNGMVPQENNVTTYQRITEAFKYGFGKRTQLGDPEFVDINEVSKGISQFSRL